MGGDGSRLAPGDRAPAHPRPGPGLVRHLALHTPKARRSVAVPRARTASRSPRLLSLRPHRSGPPELRETAGSPALPRGRALLREGGRHGPGHCGHGQGRLGSARGRHRSARACGRGVAPRGALPRTLGWALATAGRKGEARTILEELRARPPAAPAVVSEAWLLGALGEVDAGPSRWSREPKKSVRPTSTSPGCLASIPSAPTQGSRRCWRGWGSRRLVKSVRTSNPVWLAGTRRRRLEALRSGRLRTSSDPSSWWSVRTSRIPRT